MQASHTSPQQQTLWNFLQLSVISGWIDVGVATLVAVVAVIVFVVVVALVVVEAVGIGFTPTIETHT
jgi:hypothetical protein